MAAQSAKNTGVCFKSTFNGISGRSVDAYYHTYDAFAGQAGGCACSFCAGYHDSNRTSARWDLGTIPIKQEVFFASASFANIQRAGSIAGKRL